MLIMANKAITTRKPLLKARNSAPYFFIAPYFIFYFLIGLFPIVYSFFISLTNWNGMNAYKVIGFANYTYLFFKDHYFLLSIKNTAIFMVGTMPFIMVFGLLLALGLQSRLLHAKKVFRVLNFLPYITTPVAIGLIFAMLFDQKTGAINQLIVSLGILPKGINWLGVGANARIVVILMSIWKWTGYQMVFFAAGLSVIPVELYEAAWIDGAKPHQTFLKITLPHLSPIIVFLTITNIIGGFQLLDEPMLLINGFAFSSQLVGGVDRACLTAIWDLYDTAFGSTFNFGRGAAIAYSLFLFIFVFAVIGYFITNRRGDET